MVGSCTSFYQPSEARQRYNRPHEKLRNHLHAHLAAANRLPGGCARGHHSHTHVTTAQPNRHTATLANRLTLTFANPFPAPHSHRPATLANRHPTRL